MTGLKNILLTGGGGFIGSHVADALLSKGYSVSVLDNLDAQVHEVATTPEYLDSRVEFIRGDIRDSDVLLRAIKGSDAIIHLAAAVGVGQSMYEVDKYVSVNTYGTSLILNSVISKDSTVRKVVVASSMSIYGEGAYTCESCRSVGGSFRSDEQLIRADWEPKCANCGSSMTSTPTGEDKQLQPTSIYAQTKRHQEEMTLLIGKTYGLPCTALRFFNVYGPRQSLRNPYTGVATIFLSRLLNGKQPYIFEDGRQLRDFVHVTDVARAVVMALESDNANNAAINVGSGAPISILEIAALLSEHLGLKISPLISQRYRKGDIRHCYADISKAKKLLGYSPQVGIRDGLDELVEWAKDRHLEAVDSFDKAFTELEQRKLT